MTRKLHAGFAVAFVCASFGCGDDTSMMDASADAGTDAAEPMPLAGCPGGTCFFVAERIDIPLEEEEMCVGRNIDGATSGRGDLEGCGKQDWTHPRTGEVGVDNQVQTLVPAVNLFLGDRTVSEFLANVISEGTLALLMKLEGADATEDDEVTITVYRGAVPAGREITLDPDGTIAEQTFDINLAALVPVSVQGVIRGGRVVAELDDVTLPLSIGGGMLVLRVRDAELSATITERGLVDGEMSGRLNVAEFAAAAEGIAMGLDVAGLLADTADLNPDADGACQDISAAIVFDGIPAVEGETY